MLGILNPYTLQQLSDIIIPEGAIVPYKGNIASPPSGWAEYILPATTQSNQQGWYLRCAVVPKTFIPANVNTTTDSILINNHKFKDRVAVKFSTTGTLPIGLNSTNIFYIIKIDDNNFNIANTINGSAINLTNGGTGTHSIYQCEIAVPKQSLNYLHTEVTHYPGGIPTATQINFDTGFSYGEDDAGGYYQNVYWESYAKWAAHNHQHTLNIDDAKATNSEIRLDSFHIKFIRKDSSSTSQYTFPYESTFLGLPSCSPNLTYFQSISFDIDRYCYNSPNLINNFENQNKQITTISPVQSGGEHNHGLCKGSNGECLNYNSFPIIRGTGYNPDSQGDHSHTFDPLDFNLLINLTNCVYQLWEHKTSNFNPIENMIIFWDGTGGLDVDGYVQGTNQKWHICDGTHGTIDLQGYFIKFGNSYSTSSTNNITITHPGIDSDNFEHGHTNNGTSSIPMVNGAHELATFVHNHMVNTTVENYEPGTYFLYLIQKV